MSPSFPQITGLFPRRATPGGRVRLDVSGLELTPGRMPAARIGDRAASVAFASGQEIGIVVPGAIEGGRLPVRLDDSPGATAYLDVGRLLANGLHMVDSPAIGPDAAIYVTYSGARGQQATVSIYRVLPNGVRDVFVTGITNATSMAFDPEGRLHVSSRFDGTVLRVDADGAPEVVASDLGVATGLTFDREGVLYVGDRSGTIFRLIRGGPTPFASLPPSVAAYHLAAAPDGSLYATAPTLATRDAVYRIDRHGAVTTVYEAFGRPQGLAIDAEGVLYVTEALASLSGVYRLRPGGGPPELVIAGSGLIGVALHPAGGFVVCTSDTLYRFDPLDQ